MRTFEEIRTLLADKLSKEKKRLKSFGTKTDSFQMANAIARHVQALMSESRNSELKRLKKYLQSSTLLEYKGKLTGFGKYVEERFNATAAMAKALQNTADKAEKERPWKYKEKDKDKKKHKHHRRHK